MVRLVAPSQLSPTIPISVLIPTSPQPQKQTSRTHLDRRNNQANTALLRARRREGSPQPWKWTQMLSPLS